MLFKTLIELALILLLVYGFYHEDKVIVFEKKLAKAIEFKTRRMLANFVKNCESLRARVK